MILGLNKPYILGLSVAGSFHLKEGLPCQDACAYKIYDGRIGFIAVADGLGSASLSHIGARLSVESAIKKASELIYTNPFLLREIPLKMIESARLCLKNKAEELGIEVSDLATTLITVIFDNNSLRSAQIGDGAIVVQSEGQLEIISYSSHSEYANEVIPVTSDEYLDYLIEAHFDSNLDCIAVFTDGCQRASLKKVANGYLPFDGFFRPVFTFASNIDSLEKGNKELGDFLLSQKMSEHSEDDKTLVLAVI
ncbi:MAG: protein phosphatase 2C domain-containing protein [Thermodesulfovibrionales bacterium]|nr:protein phosphatase 2C domain-containing protein [Thermodesulfovibrionales bacterium]